MLYRRFRKGPAFAVAPWVMFALAVGMEMSAAEATGPTVLVGMARVDITPELPIWLSGYQARPAETQRIDTRLYARALAIGADAQKPAILLTVELIGIGEETSEAVARVLQAMHGIERARLAICATHVHSGPALADVLPFMFSKDLPAEEARRIARYTETLREKLVEVAEAALKDRRPGRLGWAVGKSDFAAQRRVVVDGKWKTFGVVAEGPVDHALPVLRVTDERGTLRGVFLNYACHCTAIGAGDNFVHHDWAGDAARRLESAHEGSVALVAIGCGADANPNPRGANAVAGHGAKIATEVSRLLGGRMRDLGPVTATGFRRIELDFDRVVSRDELEKRTDKGAKQTPAYAAAQLLRRLNAGDTLPVSVPYPVQAWMFGDELAMVFLAGEVVAEYSLRLKRELNGPRLWVNAYANSVPCYIPSQRMFSEGGYEVDGSMDYYGWPTRLARGTEDQIVETVRELVEPSFRETPQR